MAITGWRGISNLCLALSVDAPPRATVMNLTITARDTSLERGHERGRVKCLFL
jgi:hypothetical protein